MIAGVRRLTGAGTAEYTVGTVSYFGDDQIEEVLDSRRVRMARSPINFEYELSDGGGTVIYKNAEVGIGWLEDTASGTAGFIMTDCYGSILAGSLYVLSPEDGHITFVTDQAGSDRYVTGWIHNPYKAAVDILTSWIVEFSKQVDWASDNMRVNRSQKAKALTGQLTMLKEMANMAPKLYTVNVWRSDIAPEERDREEFPPFKYEQV